MRQIGYLVLVFTLLLCSFSLGHEQTDGQQSSRVSTPTKRMCVCQYQTAPTNCHTGGAGQAPCEALKDCIWVERRNLTAVCRNRFQHQCDIKFNRQGGNSCEAAYSIPQENNPPSCNASFGSYDYYYEGHGGRVSDLLGTVQTVITSSSPDCSFTFKEGSCLSFSNVDRYGSMHRGDVRAYIKNNLRRSFRYPEFSHTLWNVRAFTGRPL